MIGCELSVTGTTVTDWIDDPGPTGYCRLNPRRAQHLRRHRCTVGDEVTLQATFDGDVPTDAELGDDLCLWVCHEAPTPYPLAIEVTSGTSAEATMTPLYPGHYAVSVRRDGSGCWYFHFDAEPAA